MLNKAKIIIDYRPFIPLACFLALPGCAKPDPNLNHGVYGTSEIFADTYDNAINTGTTQNIFSDQLGVQMTGVSPPDGLNSETCSYTAMSQTGSTDMQSSRTQLSIYPMVNDLAIFRVKQIQVKYSDGFFGKYADGGTCYIHITKYSMDGSTPPPSGITRQTISTQSYDGSIGDSHTASLFNGELLITSKNGSSGHHDAGSCVYSATLNGTAFDKPGNTSVDYFYNLKTDVGYRVDVSATKEGYGDVAPCEVDVQRFKAVLPVALPADQTQLPVLNAQPLTQSTSLETENMTETKEGNLTITPVKAELVELEAPETVYVDPDVESQYYARTYALGIEYGIRSGDSVTYNGGVNVGPLSAGVSAGFTSELTETVKPTPSFTIGVNLNGKKCTKWEIRVYGTRITAVAKDPQENVDDLPFRYVREAHYQMKNLCAH